MLYVPRPLPGVGQRGEGVFVQVSLSPDPNHVKVDDVAGAGSTRIFFVFGFHFESRVFQSSLTVRCLYCANAEHSACFAGSAAPLLGLLRSVRVSVWDTGSCREVGANDGEFSRARRSPCQNHMMNHLLISMYHTNR